MKGVKIMNKSIESIVNEYGTMLYRISFTMLGNNFDAEDAVQETFIKYIKKSPDFDSAEHEKAWLIRVVTNKCRDILRFRFKYLPLDLDSLKDCVIDEKDERIISALYALPKKFKTVLYLYYVQEYKINEIASIIEKTPSAVKMRLQKGRKILKKIYLEEVNL